MSCEDMSCENIWVVKTWVVKTELWRHMSCEDIWVVKTWVVKTHELWRHELWIHELWGLNWYWLYIIIKNDDIQKKLECKLFEAQGKFLDCYYIISQYL